MNVSGTGPAGECQQLRNHGRVHQDEEHHRRDSDGAVDRGAAGFERQHTERDGQYKDAECADTGRLLLVVFIPPLALFLPRLLP